MRKKLRLVLIIALVVAALAIPLGVVVAQDSTSGTAYVLVANFSPDSPAVDIYINNTLLGESLEFAEGAYPVAVETKDPVLVDVRISNAALTDAPVVQGYTILGNGEYYMIPVMNIRERAQFGAYVIPVLNPLGEDQTRVQFFHAVPEGPRFDIKDGKTGQTFIEALGYVEDPITSANLEAGDYNWQVWANNRVIVPHYIEDPDAPPGGLAYDLGTLRLRKKEVYSFYIIGSPTGDPEVVALVLAMPQGGGDPLAPPRTIK